MQNPASLGHKLPKAWQGLCVSLAGSNCHGLSNAVVILDGRSAIGLVALVRCRLRGRKSVLAAQESQTARLQCTREPAKLGRQHTPETNGPDRSIIGPSKGSCSNFGVAQSPRSTHPCCHARETLGWYQRMRHTTRCEVGHGPKHGSLCSVRDSKPQQSLGPGMQQKAWQVACDVSTSSGIFAAEYCRHRKGAWFSLPSSIFLRPLPCQNPPNCDMRHHL